MALLLTVKLTVPDGATGATVVALTVAVKVTESPTLEEVGAEDASAKVAVSGLTV